MPGNLLLKEASIITLEVSGAAVTTGSLFLATTTLDNRSGGNAAQTIWCNFQLSAGMSIAASTGTAVAELYLVPALDGTNYADINQACNFVQGNLFRGTFYAVLSQNSAQVLVLEGIPVQPLLYKVYMINKNTGTLSANWGLKVVPAFAQYT